MADDGFRHGARLGQPSALIPLVIVKGFDSFGFLGLRALLILYLTQKLKLDDSAAFDLVGAFLSLSFLTPLSGGLIADRFAGLRDTAFVGVMLTSSGYLLLAVSATEDTGGLSTVLIAALALITAGNGFVKSCVMTMVGALYSGDDPRRDGGFSIGYMGMNIGGLLAAASAGAIAFRFGWAPAFLLLAMVNATGLAIFLILGAQLPGRRPDEIGATPARVMLAGATLGTVGVAALLMLAHQVLGWLIVAAAIAAIAHVARQVIRHGTAGDRGRAGAAVTLALFAVIAWVFIEQSAGSLNLLAARHLPATFLSLPIAPPQYQSLNGIFLILLAPALAALWLRLGRLDRDPGFAAKFAFGLLFFAMAFGTLGLAALRAPGPLISPWWLVACYFLSAIGEMLISPIGLSMITRLAMPRLAGTMMGLWFLAFAGGEYLAQMIGKVTALTPTGTAGSLSGYGAAFLSLAAGAVGFAGLLLAGRPILARWQAAP